MARTPPPEPDPAPNGAHLTQARRRLRALLEVARGRKRALVHLQHNPDPDALASGVAVQYLLRRLLGLDTLLAHTGQVGRAENRAMLRWLGIQIIPAYKVQYSEYDLVVVVDTHPGSGTCRLPEGVAPHVVLDHHPVKERFPEVQYAFLDTEFGSTSTMVGWLMVENGIPVDRRVATALTYGIKTDTQDLVRTDGPHDAAVFHAMYPLADKKLLGRIERARLPQEYFEVLERGLRNGRVTDFAVTTYLGAVRHSDAVAEIADVLFRLEGMKWAMVGGQNGPLMYLSFRAVRSERVDAGKVAAQISDGYGGGHETYAGAQVPVPEDTTPDAFYQELWERFVKAVRAKKSLSRPLTLPPGA